MHTVPVLKHGDLFIRDSLSITEWIAEQAEPGRVWPIDPAKRALARSVCAEMHSGFIALRSQMPVNIRANSPTPPIEGDLEANINRVLTIWSTCLADHESDGPFVFGDWSAADAFYAPVVTRFRTYGYALDGMLAEYAETIWTHPLLMDLRPQADAEPLEIEKGPFGAVARLGA